MTLTDKVAGHQAARKVGDMRVTGIKWLQYFEFDYFLGITGEYPTQVPESEAVSPWESGGAVQDKQTLVVGGAVANQAKDFPTQALKHQQNKPQVTYLLITKYMNFIWILRRFANQTTLKQIHNAITIFSNRNKNFFLTTENI